MPVGILALLAVLLIIVAVASKRFERRQRKTGRWDEYGPLEESQAPYNGWFGGLMNFHKEAMGGLKARVTRRRRPHEPPQDWVAEARHAGGRSGTNAAGHLAQSLAEKARTLRDRAA